MQICHANTLTALSHWCKPGLPRSNTTSSEGSAHTSRKGEEPPSGAPPASSAISGGVWCHWSLGTSVNFWSSAMELSLSQRWTLQTFLSQHKKSFHCLWLEVLQSLQEHFNWWGAHTFATKSIQYQEAPTGESFFYWKLPGWCSGKEPICQCRRCGFGPWVGKIPWSGKWQPTPVFLPGESHR